MNNKRKARIIVAKFGLDGHSNGIQIVSRWLREAGFEVIYMGLYNTAEGVIKAAIQEDVDIIGCSFLEGAHMFFTKQLLAKAAEHNPGHLKFVLGGVIPPEDVNELKEMGVAEVFTPGTPRDVIIEGLESLVSSP